MPQNTTNSNLGTEVGYQNPGTVNLVLDSEVQGVDPVTGAQLTREFVVPVESISGQSSLELLVPLMASAVRELRLIRLLLEAGAVPGDVAVDDEDVQTADEPETEAEES